MLNIKKLVFAPIFLISFAILNFALNNYLNSFSPTSSFSLNFSPQFIVNDTLNLILDYLPLILSILFSSIFFAIFVSLSQDWKIVIPIIIVASILPPLVNTGATGMVLGLGFLVSLLLTFLLIEKGLKSYLTFNPSSIFSPPIKRLNFLLVLVITFAFYLNANSQIQEKGFEIPDSLIEAAINFASPTSNPGVKGARYIAQVPQITPEQIEFLRQNPELLKQYGLDPSALDTVEQSLSPAQSQSNKPVQNSPQSQSQTTTNSTNKSVGQSNSTLPQTTTLNPPITQPSNDFIKTLVKNQLQKAMEPYLPWIPIVVALIFYFTLSFLVSIFSILTPPILYIIFYVLEKSGFIHFQEEQRPVKKMVV
jgi:hypothetical protein